VILPDQMAYRWTLDYQPNGLNNGGQMRVTFDDSSHTLEIDPKHIHAGATFDRSGLFSIHTGGHLIEFYVDDLTDTERLPR